MSFVPLRKILIPESKIDLECDYIGSLYGALAAQKKDSDVRHGSLWVGGDCQVQLEQKAE